MESPTITLTLKEGRDKPVRQRHPWIFSGAIARLTGQPAPGDLVTVADHRGQRLATAYYNAQSQIQARILSWNPDEPIDDDFWRGRLRQAIMGRASAGEQGSRGAGANELLTTDHRPLTTALRLVNAEADRLPGLVVDRYGDYLVMQCLTLGIDRRKEMITRLLVELLQPAGILERSDVDVRGKEGLRPLVELRYGEVPPEITIRENGFAFLVDVHHGHKTGFYLDQRDNRAIVGQPALMAGRDVLNVFAYTGAFGVYAAAAGARSVVQIDSSAPALEMAERHMALNNLARPEDEYIAGDAFEVLRYFRETGRQFDAVILDPPKFAHTQGQVDRAARGYKDLNWLALRLLRPEGVLATFSCSGLVSADLFQKIVFGAAVDAGRDAQIVQHLGQAADHPVLLSFPESAYLKGLLCRAL
ncbi:Ribosomal RNA large subunit methyltransferase I [Candidatus Promineifilum breve]|uniref:Ribosomal RNA large subunit methyltransferase I n=1 Tax=Candidatus Promineifilum breve TaxID=1806508 RepID=A0A161KAY9_9CHLR|nr:class I SAM-dependent rRNA methyltransferase [Candidatus Promineifilum breve]CUS04683.2 Ribosomal RNA large subunit methyltransferase I [Candidatus Promineifilum breve]